MEKELFILDMVDFLPDKISSLLFNEEVEDLIKNSLKLTSESEDLETAITMEISNLLIGKISLDDFKNNLSKNFADPKNATIVYEYLYQRLLKNILPDLLEASKIYRFQIGEGSLEKNSSSENAASSATDFAEYIKHQAEQIKASSQKASEKPPPKNIDKDPVAEEIVKKEVLSETVSDVTSNQKITHEVPKAKIAENIIIATKKEPEATPYSPLTSMIEKQKRKEAKLSLYYKNLKNTMNNDFSDSNQKANIFQPPYKSKKTGAMLETSFAESSQDVDLLAQKEGLGDISSNNGIKDPIKYNSVNINKPSGAMDANVSDIETDDKFIDLGGNF